MDNLIIKLMTLGVPFSLLYLVMKLTESKDYFAALLLIGKPLGVRGGICLLIILGLVISILTKVVIDRLLLKYFQRRSQFLKEEELISEIDRLPISPDLKIKLKWSFLHKDISWQPNFKRFIPRSFMLAAILASLLSLTGYLGEIHYSLEMTSHFKLQYLVVGFCTLFFFLLTRRQKWAIVSIFCILINLVEIVPWYLPQLGNSNAIAAQVRILQSNVLYKNKQYSQVISLVKSEKPDLAVFVEVSEKWMKELAVLKDTFPYSFNNQDSSNMGTAIYSKLPLENSSIIDLSGDRKTLVTDVKVKGSVFSLIASHLYIPTSKQSFKFRNQQLVRLADYLTTVKQPLVALGDWNITMWSPFYKHFISQTKLKNARYGFGIIPSWPTTFSPLLIPIDQSLVSSDIKVLSIRTGRKVGSDHLPVIQDLAIP